MTGDYTQIFRDRDGEMWNTTPAATDPTDHQQIRLNRRAFKAECSDIDIPISAMMTYLPWELRGKPVTAEVIAVIRKEFLRSRYGRHGFTLGPNGRLRLLYDMPWPPPPPPRPLTAHEIRMREWLREKFSAAEARAVDAISFRIYEGGTSIKRIGGLGLLTDD